MRFAPVFVSVILALFLFGCGNDPKAADPQPTTTNTATNSQQAQAFQSITPQAALELIKTRKDLLLIDVRGPEELRSGAIAGSVLLPFWNILQGKHQLPKDKPLLLICAVGGRSFAVGQVLKRQGYGEMYNLSGGLDAWKKAGLPVEFPK